MLKFLFGEKKPAASEPVKIVYVSTDRAVVEVGKMLNEVRESVAAKNHFMQWARGETGWPSPARMFEDALKNGKFHLSSYHYGSVWPTDEGLIAQFKRAAAQAGFNVEFYISDSEGPEANTFHLIITPMNNT